ncbi:MAG TPA: OsmC family protein [Bacteroidia bacterium]|nr:OsmC family protein [Bacteroidia bacterium]
METIRTIYLGDLRTEAEHVKSGEKIITDAPVDNQGKGEAFSPTDLMSASLGSCMMTLMGIAARTHEIPFENIGCKITKIMAANPRRVQEIVVEFDMGSTKYSDKEKRILSNAAKTCPVALSLHPDLLQTVSFNFS